MRLGKIAKVLGEACRLFDEAKQDDLINDLHSAWRDQITGKSRRPNRTGLDPPMRVPREFAQKFATLSKLHAAVCKARRSGGPQGERRKGSVLDRGYYLDILAHQYRVEHRARNWSKLTDNAISL